MFRRSTTPSPYDEIVLKATADDLTEVPWDVLLTIWEKVNEEGESGARQCIAALQKRLQHRSANVQLYSLTLAEALVKNCKKPLHREISSKTFTEILKRLEFDRNTHNKVKVRIAGLVRDWTEAFESDESLGIMSETFDAMKAKGVSFDDGAETPHGPTDEQLKREEEDIQRAIEASTRETSARQTGYRPSYYEESSRPSPYPTSNPQKALPADPPSQSNSNVAANGASSSRASGPSASSTSLNNNEPSISSSPTPANAKANVNKKVRALYDFDAAEEGELPLRKGDVVRVINSAYKDWWRGEKGGRVGIFPVTYVEVLPDPSREELVREMEAEAAVFSRATDIERLLDMLRTVEAQNGNLTDNDELTELYNQCLSLRPKIVKLLDKYKERTNELVEIHRRFTEAKNDYEAMMEARYPGANMGRYQPAEHYSQSPAPLSYGLPYAATNQSQQYEFGYGQQQPYSQQQVYGSMNQAVPSGAYYDYYGQQQQAPVQAQSGSIEQTTAQQPQQQPSYSQGQQLPYPQYYYDQQQQPQQPQQVTADSATQQYPQQQQQYSQQQPTLTEPATSTAPEYQIPQSLIPGRPLPLPGQGAYPSTSSTSVENTSGYNATAYSQAQPQAQTSESYPQQVQYSQPPPQQQQPAYDNTAYQQSQQQIPYDSSVYQQQPTSYAQYNPNQVQQQQQSAYQPTPPQPPNEAQTLTPASTQHSGAGYPIVDPYQQQQPSQPPNHPPSQPPAQTSSPSSQQQASVPSHPSVPSQVDSNNYSNTTLPHVAGSSPTPMAAAAAAAAAVAANRTSMYGSSGLYGSGGEYTAPPVAHQQPQQHVPSQSSSQPQQAPQQAAQQAPA